MKKYPIYTLWLIVGYHILVFSTFSFAQVDPFTTSTDIIYFNGSIVTMDEYNPSAEAIAIRGDSILAIGNLTQVSMVADQDAILIDLKGKTVMPGIVDSHTHLLNDAQGQLGLSLSQAQQLGIENGITTIGDMFVTEEFLNDISNFNNSGKLKIRTSLYLVYTDNCGNIIGDWYKNYAPTRNFGELLRIGGVKIFTDGGTCGLPGVSFEYVNGGGHGDIYFSQTELNQIVKNINDAGYQIAIHALGDSAINLAQNAINLTLNGQPNILRHRIEHNSIIRPSLIPKFSEIGIIPTVFGYIKTCDEIHDSLYEYYLGTNRYSWVRPNKLIIDENPGLPVAWSSDYPWVGPLNPFQQLFTMVTRKEMDSSGSICEPPEWLKLSGVSVEQGLKMMTYNSAYSLFREKEVGSLKPGKLADLIIISENPLTINVDSLYNIKVLMTMIGGEIVYCDSRFNFLCSDKTENMAFNKQVTASSALPDNQPKFAVDGDVETSWISGDMPPQWIEIDLEGLFKIGQVNLIVDQYPSGETQHTIWAKQSLEDSYDNLYEIQKYTSYGDTLIFVNPNHDKLYQYIKIETTKSPSWVSWKEIEIYNPLITSEESNRWSQHIFDFKLNQNYPNPFNPSTKIKYEIPTAGYVSLKIFDIMGREINSLINKQQPAGSYEVSFNVEELSSGIYFYQLKQGNYIKTRKMMLLK